MGLLRNMLLLAVTGVAATFLAGLGKKWWTSADVDSVDGREGEHPEGMADAEPGEIKMARSPIQPFDTPEPDPLVQLSGEGRAATAE